MQLLGKAQDKAFWQEVREKECFSSILRKLKKEYGKLLDEGPLQCHKYREYKMFWTTGERKVYEKSYNVFRNRLDMATVLALVYPEEDAYLDDLMDTVYAICDEYSWCWPAHQGALEINDNCHIDLLASMTAAQLAEVYTVLEDRLEPLIKNRIKAEIDRRVIKPYLATDNYGWWERGDTNWTAVCVGDISRAIMLMRPELMDDALIKRTLESIESYLTGFDDSGVCFEGMGYWRYGVGHFVNYSDMIYKFTDGKINFFEREKVKNIASFYQKMFLSGDVGISFSDGGGAMRYPVFLLHYLKNKYPSDVLVYDKAYAHWDCMTLRSYIWYDDVIFNNPAPDTVGFDFFSADAQWMIKRTANYGFAAKGGSNGEPHNHNDVGSFIFAKEGEHVFTDMGGGLYSRQYFDESTRYTFIECSSKGHSVPIIDDVCQSYGKEFKAKDAKYENGVFSVDIAGAYECEGLNSIVREFKMTETDVAATDTFDYTGNGKIVDRIATRHEPKVVSEGLVTAGKGSISFDPQVCDLAINSQQDSRDNTIWFIDFTLKKGVRSITYLMK